MFGVLLPPRPLLAPSQLQTISPTQHAYTFPSHPPPSHLVVFLLPDTSLPPDAAAAIYIRFSPPAGSPPGEFKLLGAIDMSKQSAIFKIRNAGGDGSAAPGDGYQGGAVVGEVNGNPEIDMDADVPEPTPADPRGAIPTGEITLGISIEATTTLAPQLAALAEEKASTTGAVAPGDSLNDAMTLYKPPAAPAVTTKVLAQRIIKNAFNFLASFAGGDEMVPLKSFEGWWKKFERRIDADPGFLEREDAG